MELFSTALNHLTADSTLSFILTFLYFYQKHKLNNKGLVLLTPYVVLDYDFEYVILSYLNLHVLVQNFINYYIFSSIKNQIG